MNIGGSIGAQVNRTLDALGLPSAFGDAIGALADLKTGNLAGAFRNLVDLKGGMSTPQMDSVLGGSNRPGFARAYAPRCGCTGPHLKDFQNTYAVREQVGKRAQIGEKYGFNWGPFQLQGRITGAQYSGSFAKPIQLADGDFLFRGMKYDKLSDIFRDARDGRIDGQAWRPGTNARPTFPAAFAFHPAMAALGTFGGAANAAGGAIGAGIGGAANAIGTGIQDILDRLFGNVGGKDSAGGTGSGGGTGSTGAIGDTGSVLSDPSLSLEQKLALLMSKLTEHLDKQIEQKMKDIEGQMASDKKGGAGGADSEKKSGGIFGKIAGIAGGAIGTLVGGPLGGMVGSKLGGALGGGGSAGGTGGTQGAGGQNSSNLQLLQTQLQQLLEKRQQMFQTMSNIMKSLHDTSMNTIRQLKA